MKIVSWVVVGLLLLPSIFAIGVSPPRLIFESMNRGSSAEQSVFVSGVPIGNQIQILVEGDLSSWVDAPSFLVMESAQQELFLKVNVPSTAENGNYTQKIQILEGGSQGEGQTSMSVKSGVSVTLFIEVTGKQVSSYVVKDVVVGPVDESTLLPLEFVITNTGTINTAIPFTLLVKNYQGQTVLEHEGTLQTPDPKTTESVLYELEHELSKGSYQALIDVGGYSFDKSFDVLTAGALQKDASLVHLSVEKGMIGELIPIRALVDNTGNVPIIVQLEADILKDNELLTSIQSDQAEIAPEESMIITAYYQPSEQGEYLIQGTLLFGDERSEMKQAIMIVGSQKEPGFPDISLSIGDTQISLGAIILIVIFLFITRILVKRWKKH